MKVICEECSRLFRYEEPFELHSVSTEACHSGEGCPFKLKIARMLLNTGKVPGFHPGLPSARKEVIAST